MKPVDPKDYPLLKPYQSFSGTTVPVPRYDGRAPPTPLSMLHALDLSRIRYLTFMDTKATDSWTYVYGNLFYPYSHHKSDLITIFSAAIPQSSVKRELRTTLLHARIGQDGNPKGYGFFGSYRTFAWIEWDQAHEFVSAVKVVRVSESQIGHEPPYNYRGQNLGEDCDIGKLHICSVIVSDGIAPIEDVIAMSLDEVHGRILLYCKKEIRILEFT